MELIDLDYYDSKLVHLGSLQKDDKMLLKRIARDLGPKTASPPSSSPEPTKKGLRRSLSPVKAPPHHLAPLTHSADSSTIDKLQTKQTPPKSSSPVPFSQASPVLSRAERPDTANSKTSSRNLMSSATPSSILKRVSTRSPTPTQSLSTSPSSTSSSSPKLERKSKRGSSSLLLPIQSEPADKPTETTPEFTNPSMLFMICICLLTLLLDDFNLDYYSDEETITITYLPENTDVLLLVHLDVLIKALMKGNNYINACINLF